MCLYILKAIELVILQAQSYMMKLENIHVFRKDDYRW